MCAVRGLNLGGFVRGVARFTIVTIVRCWRHRIYWIVSGLVGAGQGEAELLMAFWVRPCGDGSEQELGRTRGTEIAGLECRYRVVL